MNLTQMLPMFLDSRKRGVDGAHTMCDPGTVSLYKFNLNIVFTWMAEQGVLRFMDVQRLTMRNLYDWMQAKQDSGKWSKAYRLGILRSLRAFLHWATKDEECQELKLDDKARSLLAKFPRLEASPTREDIPKLRDVKQWLNVFDTKTLTGHRDFVACWFMMDNGMRIKEMCGIRLSDIDWDLKIVTVLGKGSKPRNVPISAGMVPYLKGWITRRRKLKAAQNSEYLFLTRTGPKMSPKGFGHHMRETRLRNNLPRLTPHVFRHLFCTNYLAKGGDMNRLMNITGHRSYKTVHGYLHQVQLARKESRDEFEKVTLVKEL